MNVLRKGPSEGSIASDSTQTLSLRVVQYALAFAASVLISRALGPEGRGLYALPIVAAAAVTTFSKLGFEQANVFLLGTRRLSLPRVFGQSGLVSTVMGGVGVPLLLLIALALPRVFSDTPRVWLLLAGLAIPFSLHSQLAAGLLTLRGRVTWQFRANLIASAIQLLILLSLFLLGRLDVPIVIAINLLAMALTWAITVWPFVGTGMPWIRWDVGLLRETLGHSLVLHLGMMLFFLHLRLDMFMLKAFAGAVALGFYSLAVVLAETVLLATDSLAISILPRQLGNVMEDAASVALLGARMSAILGLSGGIVLGVLGRPVIRVAFGQAFVPSYLPLIALLPGVIFLGVQRVCGAPVLRTGRAWRLVFIYAVSVVCNVLLNLWWIPLWGPVGAALASSVSYGLGAVLFLMWTAALAGQPIRRALLPRRSDWLMVSRAILRYSHALTRRQA